LKAGHPASLGTARIQGLSDRIDKLLSGDRIEQSDPGARLNSASRFFNGLSVERVGIPQFLESSPGTP
jgi:hypothetical protein